MSWIRGHDPEFEFRKCNGDAPSQSAALEVLKSQSLAAYSHDQLHLLMMCNGIWPENATDRPVDMILPKFSQEQCALLPVGSQGRGFRVILGIIFLLGLAWLANYLFMERAKEKVKTDNEDSRGRPRPVSSVEMA